MGNAFPIPNPIDCLVQLLEDPEFLDIILDDDDLEDDLQPVREDIRDFRRKQFSNRRAAPRQRDRAYALREMSQLSEFQFQRMFRLNRAAFYHLLGLIHHEISPRPSLNHIFHHAAKLVTPETRLAITLRWLAGGSYLDICFAFGVSIGSFFRSDGLVWPTIMAIDNALKIDVDVTDKGLLNTDKELGEQGSKGG